MKINLPRLNTKRRRLFLSLMACLLIPDILSLMVIGVLKATNDDSKWLQSIEQQIKLEFKQMQSMSAEINKLKKSYQNLNKQLATELSFKEGLKFVLAAEGGVSDDAADKGGLTNLGITHAEYASYRAKKGLAPRSVREISYKETSDIYKHIYWLNSGCANTPRRIAISCFDWQVNSNRGFSTLQQTLGVGVDGIPGHESFNELNYWLSKDKEDQLLHNYFEIREADYRRWGVGSQSVFLHGWLRRAQSLKNYLKVQ